MLTFNGQHKLHHMGFTDLTFIQELQVPLVLKSETSSCHPSEKPRYIRLFSLKHWKDMSLYLTFHHSFFFTNMECIFRWSGALRVWGTISQIFTNQTIHTTTKYSAGFYPFNFEKPITKKKKSIFIMIISQRTQKYIVYSTQNVFLFLILKFALVILKFSLDLKRI